MKLKLWFQAGQARCFEFVALVPDDGLGGADDGPTQLHAEAIELGVAGEVPIGVVVVSEIVVVVFFEVLELGFAEGAVVAFEECPFLDGKGGNADP